MIPTTRIIIIAICCFLMLSSAGNGGAQDGGKPPVNGVTNLPDLSGLAWIEGDTFLAVHDAKNPEENDRPRVSLLRLPQSLDGIGLTNVTLQWPQPLGLSGDLESVARIPGTDFYLLVESGEGRHEGTRFNRMFLARIVSGQVIIDSFSHLPDSFKNIESSAVAKLGNRLVFICAERGDHRAVTEVYWTELQLQPLRLGKFNKRYFRPLGFMGTNKRPASAMEVDALGRIYIASAYDPGDDSGPFKSVIWRAGRIWEDRGNVRLSFHAAPYKLATLDGLKVESLAIRETKGTVELFAGSDDENYGSAVRPISLLP